MCHMVRCIEILMFLSRTSMHTLANLANARAIEVVLLGAKQVLS